MRDFRFGNPKVLPSVDNSYIKRSTPPHTGEYFIWMSAEEFTDWLAKNNEIALPIDELIENYNKEFYENNRFNRAR